jgi:hypothetical protein
MQEELFRDKGTSQSRQKLSQTHREGGQYQARAREPTGQEGIPQPGQEGRRWQKERS